MHLKNKVVLDSTLSVILPRFISALIAEKLTTENTRIGCTYLSKLDIKE